MVCIRAAAVGAVWLAIGAAAPAAHAYDVEEKGLAQVVADLAAHRVTSVELVRLYEARIDRLNPSLHAVIVLNPRAEADAAAADRARAAGRDAPLLGVPILVKDNIETADPMPTTAGSLALKDNLNGRDAPAIARLRAGGAVILGKTNLSEWADIRSDDAISGWSALGGQTRNPYALARSPCGSSSGSGAGAAASLAAAAVGTETDGSITCPSSMNGLVGLKPTVGLVSRTFVIPISHSQDTPGPMAKSVRDAAMLLQAMAGTDPADPATASADAHRTDYAAALRPDALTGTRVGVLRFAADVGAESDQLFDQALAVLKAQGATLVEIKAFPGDRDAIGKLEGVVLNTELKADLDRYLASTAPTRVPSRTLADLIAFDRAHAAEEMPLFGQQLFEQAQATQGLDDPVYLKAEADAQRMAGPDGIDRMLKDNGVAVLVAPTLVPAWLIDPVLKERFSVGGAGSLPAVAGYPHLSVPMGEVDGLPVGLSFIGPAWSDGRLLAYGYAYEQASHARRPPTYAATAPIVSHAALFAEPPATK
jgi:amidase